MGPDHLVPFLHPTQVPVELVANHRAQTAAPTPAFGYLKDIGLCARTFQRTTVSQTPSSRALHSGIALLDVRVERAQSPFMRQIENLCALTKSLMPGSGRPHYCDKRPGHRFKSGHKLTESENHAHRASRGCVCYRCSPALIKTLRVCDHRVTRARIYAESQPPKSADAQDQSQCRLGILNHGKWEMRDLRISILGSALLRPTWQLIRPLRGIARSDWLDESLPEPVTPQTFINYGFYKGPSKALSCRWRLRRRYIGVTFLSNVAARW